MRDPLKIYCTYDDGSKPPSLLPHPAYQSFATPFGGREGEVRVEERPDGRWDKLVYQVGRETDGGIPSSQINPKPHKKISTRPYG